MKSKIVKVIKAEQHGGCQGLGQGDGDVALKQHRVSDMHDARVLGVMCRAQSLCLTMLYGTLKIC